MFGSKYAPHLEKQNLIHTHDCFQADAFSYTFKSKFQYSKRMQLLAILYVIVLMRIHSNMSMVALFCLKLSPFV